MHQSDHLSPPRKLVKLAQIVFLAALLVLWLPAAQASSRQAGTPVLSTGTGQFTFDAWQGPPLPVWTYVPEGIDRTSAPILIVMHGASRDPDRYRNQWIKPAQASGFIIVAPGFSKADFPKSARYNLGGVFKARSMERRDEALWAFSSIEPLFDEVVERLGGAQTSYSIYGHSAGSQFVNRYLFFKPGARVTRYLAANAGWYTFAEPSIAFPYGLGGAGVSEAAIKAALASDMAVLLGDEDTDPVGRNLRRTPEALRQGPHRFARGQSFYAAAKAYAEERGWDFGWSLHVVEGVAHSNGGMAGAAGELVR